MSDCCEHYGWGSLRKGAGDAINGMVPETTLNQEMEDKSDSRAGGRALRTGGSKCSVVLRLELYSRMAQCTEQAESGPWPERWTEAKSPRAVCARVRSSSSVVRTKISQ